MAIAPQALKALDLTDVLGTVHAALSLNFEEYAAAMNDDNFVEALTLLTNQHSLVRQAEFLIAELSDAYGVDTVPAVDPDQLELRITATDGVTTMDATPEAPAQTHDAQPEAEWPAGLIASPALVADTEAAARVCGSLVGFFVENGQSAEANTLADAQEILLRGSGGAAAVRRAVEPQTFPAVAAGDMALFDNFAVNPDSDPQLIVGLLGTDNVLVWQMAGTVPEGAFTTLRQRLQMFADTTDCVALARVRA